jgi:hypothetical protein
MKGASMECVLRKTDGEQHYRYEFSDGAVLLSGEKFGAIFGPDGTKIWEGDMRGQAPAPANAYQYEAMQADELGVDLVELTPEELAEIEAL